MAKKKISTIKALLNAFKQGATTTAACKSAGISTVILWRWCKNWPNLAKRIEQLKDCRTPLVIDSLFAQAVQGNVQAQKFYLINKAGWAASEGSVNVKVPIEVKNNTQVNIPVSTEQEGERLKSYAQLIRSHNLISRTLGQDGQELILGNDIERCERVESPAGGDSQGNSMAH